MKHPNNTRRPARRWGALAVLALAGGLTLDALAQQVCNPRLQRTRVDARYESVAGAYPAGSEVRDKVTGFIWQRCLIGMSWSGSTCTGDPTRLDWKQALIAAASSTPSPAAVDATAAVWRLPNKAELLTLVESGCYQPALNVSTFPSLPLLWDTRIVWASSPSNVVVSQAWVLALFNGADDTRYIGNPYVALLVRGP